MDYGIYAAGIWLAGEEEGEVRASLWVLGASSLIAHSDTEPLGVYRLDSQRIQNTTIDYWPTEYGAPSDPAGNPDVIGKAMLWEALLSRKSPSRFAVFANPFQNLVVSQAVVQLDGNFEDLVIITFDITNTGIDTIDNMHIGYYADVDIYSSSCISPGSNSVGFDTTAMFSYTYPGESRGDAEMDCAVQVIGYKMMMLSADVWSESIHHVPLGKNTEFRSDGYDELSLQSPEDVLQRLEGLSRHGEPLVDPTTGEPTRYAFTGDPVSETGWLGIKSDVRSLLTSGPFAVEPGETVSLAIFIAAEKTNHLSGALDNMRSRFNNLELQELQIALEE